MIRTIEHGAVRELLLDFGAVATQNKPQGSFLNQPAFPFQKAY